MTKDEALRLALEALGNMANIRDCQREKGYPLSDADKRMREAITAVEAALEAKDEPVALKPCGYESKETKMCRKCGQVHAEAIWKTTLPQRKPLTDEEIYLCTNHIDRNARGWANEFARAIEAAHDIKE